MDKYIFVNETLSNKVTFRKVINYMKNIDIKQIELEAQQLNKMICKIKNARVGTYKLHKEDIKSAIILSNFDYLEELTNAFISIHSYGEEYFITIDEANDNGITYL